jgi:hypothetical protein
VWLLVVAQILIDVQFKDEEIKRNLALSFAKGNAQRSIQLCCTLMPVSYPFVKSEMENL